MLLRIGINIGIEKLDIGPFNPSTWLGTYKNNTLTRIILNLELVNLHPALLY